MLFKTSGPLSQNITIALCKCHFHADTWYIQSISQTIKVYSKELTSPQNVKVNCVRVQIGSQCSLTTSYNFASRFHDITSISMFVTAGWTARVLWSVYWRRQRSQHCIRVSSSATQCHSFRKRWHHDSKRRYCYFPLSFYWWQQCQKLEYDIHRCLCLPKKFVFQFILSMTWILLQIFVGFSQSWPVPLCKVY